MVLKVLSETLTECVYCTGTKVGLSVGELSSGGKVLQKLLILAIYRPKPPKEDGDPTVGT